MKTVESQPPSLSRTTDRAEVGVRGCKDAGPRVLEQSCLLEAQRPHFSRLESPTGGDSVQRGLSEVDIASMDTSIWGRVPALPRTAVLGAEPTPGVSQSSHQPRRGITLGSECLPSSSVKWGSQQNTSEGYREDGTSECMRSVRNNSCHRESSVLIIGLFLFPWRGGKSVN